jgi:hypothetical protein
MLKKLHPLKFINDCWTFMEIKQWMWAQWSGWCVTAMFWAVLHSSQLMKWTPWTAHSRKSKDYDQGTFYELYVRCSELETMLVMLEYRNVCARWVPWMLTQEHKNHKRLSGPAGLSCHTYHIVRKLFLDDAAIATEKVGCFCWSIFFSLLTMICTLCQV